MTAIDSKVAYGTWLRMIADDELGDAVVTGDVDALLDRRRKQLEFSHEERAAMADFHRQPGLKWALENLRFRSAMQTAESVWFRLPRLAKLLTGNNRSWMQQTAFEYLSNTGWRPAGLNTLEEAFQFVDYVRRRIAVTRICPPYLLELAEFELAVINTLRKTRAFTATAYPRPDSVPTDDQALHGTRPAWSIAAALIRSPVDLSDWIRSGDPLHGTVRDRPLAVLVWIPHPTARHRMQILSEGAALLFEQCIGRETVGDLAATFEREYGVTRTATVRQLRAWLSAAALAV